MVSILFQHSQWTLLRSRRDRDMRRDRMVQDHIDCVPKTNIAKGHHIAPGLLKTQCSQAMQPQNQAICDPQRDADVSSSTLHRSQTIFNVLSCKDSRLSKQAPLPFAHKALEEKQLSQGEAS